MGNAEAPPGDKASAEAQSGTYNQAFFLALAAKGKEAWNEWKRDLANKDVRVTFAGVDFSELPNNKIDFSGFDFGNKAEFSRCKWKGNEQQHASQTDTPAEARFIGAIFGDGANFKGAVFGRCKWKGNAPAQARFIGAIFGDEANFKGAVFGNGASFTAAVFGQRADFTSAAFGDDASFEGATFGARARFIGGRFRKNAQFTCATFKGTARFNCAIFGTGTSFSKATFLGTANFTGASFDEEARLIDAIFKGSAFFEGAAFGRVGKFKRVLFKGTANFAGISEERWVSLTKTWIDEAARPELEKLHRALWKSRNSGPDRFPEMKFANASFYHHAVFSGRSFEGAADFTSVRFYFPPDFDVGTNVGRVDFTGVRPGMRWTKESCVPVRLRAFRRIAERTRNHDLERDLYIEERKAERGVYLHQRWEDLKRDGWKSCGSNILRLFEHLVWIAVMGVYSALADYGRTLVRPFIWWLVLSLIIFPWWYDHILPLSQKVAPPDPDKYEQAVQMVALANAVPFVGPLAIDAGIKKILFCPGFDACRSVPPKSYQWLAIFQNLLSIVLVFFIGLALRNYFKIK